MSLESYIHKLLPICLLNIVMGCQSFEAQSIKIKVDQDSHVMQSDNSFLQVKKGESIEVPSSPVLIESPGHIATMVIPLSASTEEVSVRLRPIESWSGELYEQRANAQMSDLMAKVIAIQHLMIDRKAEDALIQFNLLEDKYPRVSYLKFLKASCLILSSRFDDAKASLEEALKEFPNDKVGLDLRKSLESLTYRQGDSR